MGTYSFEGLSPGLYEVFATLQGEGADAGFIELQLDGNSNNGDVRLGPRPRVDFVVRRAGSSGAANIPVTIFGHRQDLSDSEEDKEIPMHAQLAPGHWEFTVRTPSGTFVQSMTNAFSIRRAQSSAIRPPDWFDIFIESRSFSQVTIVVSDQAATLQGSVTKDAKGIYRAPGFLVAGGRIGPGDRCTGGARRSRHRRTFQVRQPASRRLSDDGDFRPDGHRRREAGGRWGNHGRRRRGRIGQHRSSVVGSTVAVGQPVLPAVFVIGVDCPSLRRDRRQDRLSYVAHRILRVLQATREASCRGTPAGDGCGWDGAVCAAPWLRSGGCARASPRNAGPLLRACARCRPAGRSAS